MEQNRDKNWQDLCQAAATEQNPRKLMALVAEILKTLDDRDRKAGSPARNKERLWGSPLPTRCAGVHRRGTTCGSGLSV
jgi:hypothetical protein